jgi:sulfite reductase alpha subunit-like flavoprotein
LATAISKAAAYSSGSKESPMRKVKQVLEEMVEEEKNKTEEKKEEMNEE